MRMRERSSVEIMRMALTEKRDMLGDMMAVKVGLERIQLRVIVAAIGYRIGSGVRGRSVSQRPGALRDRVLVELV